MPIIRRSFMLTAAALACGALALHLLAPWLDRPPIELEGPVDAIVVLGGEQPSRINLAADLYNAGVAPTIWITGDIAPRGGRVTQAEAARFAAFYKGVPLDRQRKFVTTSTWEDGAAIAAAAREAGAQRLVIVTNWYHGRRATCVIGRHLAGGEVVFGFAPAESERAPRGSWWLQVDGWLALAREAVSFIYYGARYGLDPRSC